MSPGCGTHKADNGVASSLETGLSRRRMSSDSFRVLVAMLSTTYSSTKSSARPIYLTNPSSSSSSSNDLLLKTDSRQPKASLCLKLQVRCFRLDHL